MPLRVVGAAAVRGTRVFLARRPPGGRHGGLWEFPGGKVEAGEDDRTALARELSEELAVEAEVGELLGVGRDEGIELSVYAVVLKGDPQPCEGQRCAWVSLDRLESLAMPPADRPIARALTRARLGVY